MNKGKDILIIGKGPTQGLDGTTFIEAKYPNNFTQSNKKSCLSLHYNGGHRILCVNATKIYQFKAKYSEIKIHPLCLVNISQDFSSINIKKTKKNRIKWLYLKIFC